MMRERYGYAMEKAQTVGGQVREKLSRFTSSLGNRAREGQEEFGLAAADRRFYSVRTARERSAQLRRRIRTAMEEQPLAFGALMFSLGAAVGAILPATRREARLMGEDREQFFEKTEALAREQLERARESAREAGEEVEAKVKRRFESGQQEEERPREKEPAL